MPLTSPGEGGKMERGEKEGRERGGRKKEKKNEPEERTGKGRERG